MSGWNATRRARSHRRHRSTWLGAATVVAVSGATMLGAGPSAHAAAGHPAVGHPAVGHPAVGHPAVGHPAVGHPAAGHPAAGPDAQPWQQYNESPASRTVAPLHAFSIGGAVTDPTAVVHGGTTTLSSQGASVTLDFGKEVGGYVTVGVGQGTAAGQSIGLTYSESSTQVSATSDDQSNGGSNNEPPDVYATTPGDNIDTSTAVPTVAGTPAPSAASQLRGGFRYLTVVDQTGGPIAIDSASVHITFDPGAQLRAYPNSFYSNDALLNRIWYAGAYTVQTNLVAGDTGRVWPAPAVGYDNAGVIGPASKTYLVDGAKRDRTVWPGDLGISGPTDYVSIGNLAALRNSLDALYTLQSADGALPYAGPPVDFTGDDSDTYHMWTMIDTAEYAQYAGDHAWLKSVYPQYQRALAYITAKTDASGLLASTGADWGRSDAGGVNIEAQAIFYKTLTTCESVARSVGDLTTAASCASRAATLRAAVASGGYWDPAAHLYRDTPTGSGATLYPQDGNSLAVWFGLTPGPARNRAISASLAERWTPVGASTPEESSISPFAGSMEVMAHLAAGDTTTALRLIEREWGYMLDAPADATGTFWEEYLSSPTSYVSHAHGWATGPTSALTFYVLGIRPADNGGALFAIDPHPGNLTHVQGRLATASGPITESWRRDARTGSFVETFGARSGVVSTVAVPATRNATVRLDGRVVWRKGRSTAHGARWSAGSVVLRGVGGGTHTVSASPGR